jgi:DNA-binding NarL/FixJ family response regulator
MSRDQLSEQERVVTRLLSVGYTTEGIAAEVHISTATVQRYIEQARRKLQASNRVHLVAKAIRENIIS